MDTENDVLLEENVKKVVTIKQFRSYRNGHFERCHIWHKRVTLEIFELRFYPNGDDPENEGYVSIFLKNHWIKDYPLKVRCTVSIIDVANKHRMTQSFGHENVDKRWSFGLERFVSHRVLKDEEDELLQNNSFKLFCEISYTISKSAISTANMAWNVLSQICEMFPSTESATKIVSENLEWTLEICTSEGNKYPLHFKKGERTLGSEIIAISPVFAAMLKSPMKERRDKIVYITDIDYKTLMHFFTYVESKQLAIESFEDIYLLYEMADKYQVSNLMEKCVQYMSAQIGVDTVVQLLALAYMHSDEKLMTVAARFIRTHRKKVCDSLENDSADSELRKFFHTWAKDNLKVEESDHCIIPPEEEFPEHFYVPSKTLERESFEFYE
ncbi:speckle-type POZ protein-like [Stegodyphus dumicola]|uniref:speckle-type POZ protein-like n=1 Tax=Stegodyphus dumicola TaxID=202533 RepID=UPI0015B21525|nr:speckle-type POZ protein-like [Stegodyphus dumicola]